MEDVGTAIVRLEGAVAALDQKIDRRFDAVDLKFVEVNRRFEWVKNTQFLILLAIVAGLFGIVATLMSG